MEQSDFDIIDEDSFEDDQDEQAEENLANLPPEISWCCVGKLTKFNRAISTCGHLTCDVCIRSLIEMENLLCPICCTTFTGENVIAVFTN